MASNERGTVRAPTRSSVLRILDAAMQWEDAVPQGRGMALQAAEFRDQNLQWISDRRLIGYGCVGVGTPRRNSSPNLGVALYVETDLDAEYFKANLLPDDVRIPGLARLPFEIIVLGGIAPAMSTTKTRPLQPGLSISHHDMTAGTLGAFARSKDLEDSAIYLLSCNHVITRYNAAPNSDAIVQPGKSDRGQPPKDTVATLARIVDLQYHDRRHLNKVDAALARVDDVSILPDNGNTMQPILMNRSVRSNSEVEMTGRTSGRTHGRVRDPSARLHMSYPRTSTSTSRAGFTDVVVCSAFTQKGDSGALVYNNRDEAVGMVIAGSARATIFCKIGHVCDALNISLVRGHYQ